MRIFAHDEQERTYSCRKRNNSEIESVLCSYFTEWNHYDDRRSNCYVKKLNVLITVSFYGRFTSCTLAWKNFSKNMGIPQDVRKSITHINQGWNLFIASRKICTDSRAWSHCRHKSPKRCRCSIGRPTADRFGRPRSRYSRVVSAIQGRTGRNRMRIIRLIWWNNHQNTSSTFCSCTLELIRSETPFIHSFSEGPQLWQMQTQKNSRELHLPHKSWKLG